MGTWDKSEHQVGIYMFGTLSWEGLMLWSKSEHQVVIYVRNAKLGGLDVAEQVETEHHVVIYAWNAKLGGLGTISDGSER